MTKAQLHTLLPLTPSVQPSVTYKPQYSHIRSNSTVDYRPSNIRPNVAMALGLIGIIHIVAAVFSIIELGLTGYAVSVYNDAWNGWYGGYSWSPDRVNFMLFNAIWSILVLAYVGVTPLYMTSIFHRLAALVLEAITMIFWFAGSIALAVWIGVPRCGNDHLCGSVQAAVAFGFFLW